MESVPYDPDRCITFWFRLVQSRYLKCPLSACIRVERLESPPRSDRGELTFPQEIRWPTAPLPGEDDVFEVKAAIPVPIVSRDQVLFVTLRDLLDRVVARVHVTYMDGRTLRRSGFREWYPAEPAPNVKEDEDDTRVQTSLDALAKNERTTFRLVHFLDDGDLYAHPLDPTPTTHLSEMLVSNAIDRESFNWATSVTRDETGQLLLAGAFLLPVQAILFDTDEETIETTERTRKDVESGRFLASILLCHPRQTEYDKLFVALEYASGNMCSIDVPSLADCDDYTRLAFPDGSASVYRTATDKVGALLSVLRRLERPGWHPAIVMTVGSESRRFLEAGMVKVADSKTESPETVVILSKRKCSTILLVAWRKTTKATSLDIFTRWKAKWRRQNVSTHSEVWILSPSSRTTSPHLYTCDSNKWTRIFLPALLATTPRRLSPRFCNGAINEIAQAVTDRRRKGETGGYIPLGYDISRVPIDTRAVGIQRGFFNEVVAGLSAARQVRCEQTRYAAFW